VKNPGTDGGAPSTCCLLLASHITLSAERDRVQTKYTQLPFSFFQVAIASSVRSLELSALGPQQQLTLVRGPAGTPATVAVNSHIGAPAASDHAARSTFAWRPTPNPGSYSLLARA